MVGATYPCLWRKRANKESPEPHDDREVGSDVADWACVDMSSVSGCELGTLAREGTGVTEGLGMGVVGIAACRWGLEVTTVSSQRKGILRGSNRVRCLNLSGTLRKD